MNILKKIKSKFKKYKLNGKNNKIYILKNGIKKECKYIIPGLKIFINGDDNEIFIETPIKFQSCMIVINHSGKKIHIENTPYEINNMYIEMVQPCTDQMIHLNKNISINGASFYIYGNNAKLEIGEDCMFSTDVVIMTGDGHKIADKNTGEVINNEQNEVQLGKHVWIGRRATICKGVVIPSNSVVGTNALVTKKFDKENIIIAGTPAKIIKQDIIWDREENF